MTNGSPLTEVTPSSRQMKLEIGWYLGMAVVGLFIYSVGQSNDMYHSHQKDMSVSGHRDLLVISEIQKSKLGMITTQCLFIEDC